MDHEGLGRRTCPRVSGRPGFGVGFRDHTGGVRRTEDAASGKSITRRTGRKIVSITVVLAALAAVLFAFRLLRPRPEANVNELERASVPSPDCGERYRRSSICEPER